MDLTDNLTPDPVPNIPLLRKAVEWAEAEAAKTDGTRLWREEFWAQQTDCGTSHCIAGFVVTAAVPGVSTKRHHYGANLDLFVDGKRAEWFDVGRDALQITDDEADDLFQWDNTITRVRKIAEEIAARVGERL